MNPYLKNLNKIEFVLTDACTGQCKHCAAGGHAANSKYLDAQVAADTVRKITAAYSIRTVMVFGGEALLNPDAVYAVMRAASQCNVAVRQVITNGFFSRDPAVMRAVAQGLAACGVNDLLLSVDAFHQETIPLDTVKTFAAELIRCGVPVRLSPAWLVSRTDPNPYNQKTRRILAEFEDLAILEGAGNVVFFEGNAVKYLSEYFKSVVPENPYTEDPFDINCVSVCANGDVLGGNIYRRDVMEILKEYTPFDDK